ncbi:MAG: LysR family transcriptional regulator [Gammaproteobacteria bacterium]|nr:LysR family transcriptional regulator [Gammaproteobacteria bacterium]
MSQFQEVQIFVRIVEAGGISKAADQLNLAKSAVSRKLSDLETRLNCKLIQRTTRKFHLTDAGRLYYERALAWLADYEQMSQVVHSQDEALHGNLRLSLPLSFGLAHLTPLLSEFAGLHPQLNLQIDFSDRHVDMVEEGFDLAFRIGELKDTSMQARRIVPIHFALCASPDYLQQHGMPMTPDALKSHVLLRYSAGQGAVRLLDAEGKEQVVAMNGQIQANNGDFLREMAIAGKGIVMSPTFIVWQALQSGALVQILSDYTIPPVYGYAVYPQNRYLPHKARVFIDFLAEKFSGTPYWDAAQKAV